MRWDIRTLKRVAQASFLGSSLVLGLATTASAQNPYWYDRHDSVKRHQKDEKRDLKDHQRLERAEFGNSKSLKRHQKEENRELIRVQIAQVKAELEPEGFRLDKLLDGLPRQHILIFRKGQ